MRDLSIELTIHPRMLYEKRKVPGSSSRTADRITNSLTRFLHSFKADSPHSVSCLSLYKWMFAY